jgi:pimeloyl-ACP methyl ester carboxylesterase
MIGAEMNAVHAILTRGVRTVGAASPAAASAIALDLFMRVGRRAPVRTADEATMDAARRSSVSVAGLGRHPIDVVVYEWGRGDRVVALAHGWRGRSSQFAPLVRDLVFEGYRVVAFDAPAHGESGGRRTYLFDWIDALREIQRRHGDFHAVIGHSFGALGALVAVADGLRTERVVTVAAPADADTLLTQFRGALGYDDRTAAALRRRFAHRFFPTEANPFTRISAAARPLPHGIRLVLAHDEGDRQVPFGEAARLAAVNVGATVIATQGLGHGRILVSDEFLDAALAALAEPVDASAQKSIAGSAEPSVRRAARPRDVVTI